MEIYIPTRARYQQDTWKSLPEEIRKKVIFVTPWSDDHIRSTKDIMLVRRTPPEISGIGPTRQWIIDQAKDKKIVMLDDDLVFATRRDDEPTKFRESSNADIIRLFQSIELTLDAYPSVGVATREGGNRDTGNFVFNTRLLRILAYRVDVLKKEEIRFDRLEFMEDFDVTLQLLRRGHPNCKINWIVHNQRSSNAPGGCSTYRTLEKQAAAARGLKELHPEFVTVVTKQTKTAWNGNERTDVIIGWKKAYNSRVASLLDRRAQPDPT